MSATNVEYIPRSVLLTGCCGVIGSALALLLLRKYPDVQFVNIDSLDYCASVHNVPEHQHRNYVFIKGDIRDYRLILSILEEYNIDTVLHLAAMTHVDISFGNSLLFTSVNVLGTHILLEACREYGNIRRFIHMSTDEVYGSILQGKSHVSSVLNPSNPYAATKAAAEYIVNSYFLSFKMPAIIIRCNNAFGPRQYPDKIIPKFLLHLMRGEKCPIHGDGRARRNFIYVDDIARAIDTVLCKGTVGEYYNIGTENELSVLQVVHALQTLLLGRPPTHAETQNAIVHVPDRKFNDARYAVDCSQLHALGWTEDPDSSFESNLVRTWEWFKSIDVSTYWIGSKDLLDGKTTSPTSAFPSPLGLTLSSASSTATPYSRNTILLYGARGAVASDMLQYLDDAKLLILASEHPPSDSKAIKQWRVIPAKTKVDSFVKVEAELIEFKQKYPDGVVICSLGRTHSATDLSSGGLNAPDMQLPNLRDNVFAPVLLSLLCRKHALYCVYIGTGCIFTSDTAPDRLTVRGGKDDVGDFLNNNYSAAKGYADQLMQVMVSMTTPSSPPVKTDDVHHNLVSQWMPKTASLSNEPVHNQAGLLNVRIRMPIFTEASPRDYLTRISNYKTIVTDSLNSYSILPSLWPVFFDLIERRHNGTFNLCNPGPMRNSEILDRIGRPSTDYTSTTAAKFCAQTPRAFFVIDTSELEAKYPTVKSTSAAISDVLEKRRRLTQVG